MPIQIINQPSATITTVASTAATLSVVNSDTLSRSDIPSLVSYRFTQSAVSDTWTIVHGLNFRPNVTAFDSAGNMVEGAITHTDNTTLSIAFSAAISGHAILS